MNNVKSIDINDFKIIYDNSIESIELLRSKNIFITGGTGFFGKWILNTIFYLNHKHDTNISVTILSRDPESFLIENPHLKHGLFTYLKGDVRTFPFPSNTFHYLIHGATEASEKLNKENPELMLNTIIEGTQHCLNFAKTAQIPRILLLSSGAVYGNQPTLVTHQPDDSLTGPNLHSPFSAYAEGKRVSELLGAIHAHKTNSDVMFARCYAFVGPYLPLNTHFAIGNFIGNCLGGEDLLIRGDGTPHRSYMYAADLVVWLLRILTHGKTKTSYNVGSDESLSIEDVAKTVLKVWTSMNSSSNLSIKILSPRNPENKVERYVPSTSRSRLELNLKNITPLEEAIEKTFKFHI